MSAKIIDLKKHRILRYARTLSDGGWSTHVLDSDWIPRAPVCLYVVDRAGGAVVAGVIDRDDLAGTPQEYREAGAQEAANALSAMLRAYIETPEAGEGEWQLAIMTAAALYVRKTQLFERLDEMGKAPHFVVVAYPTSNPQDRTVRPFAMRREPAGILMEPPILDAAIAQIEQMDRKNHPEWFV